MVSSRRHDSGVFCLQRYIYVLLLWLVVCVGCMLLHVVAVVDFYGHGCCGNDRMMSKLLPRETCQAASPGAQTAAPPRSLGPQAVGTKLVEVENFDTRIKQAFIQSFIQ